PGKDLSLNCVQLTVERNRHVIVLTALSQFAKAANPLCQEFRIRCDRAAVTRRSQIFAGVKAKTSDISKTSHRLAIDPCSVGLRCIFNNGKSMTACQAA